MSENIDFDPIVNRFHQRITHFGAHPYGVLWSDAKLQMRRFEMLLQLLFEDEMTGGHTFADFGCGYGAMFVWLQQQPVMQNSRYNGYDITPAMIHACLKHIQDPAAQFEIAADVSRPADFVFASGTFALKCATENRDWEDFVKNQLERLWQKSKKGLAVNFLDHSVVVKDTELYYADREQLIGFCKDRLTDKVQVQVDPRIPEFTLLLRR